MSHKLHTKVVRLMGQCSWPGHSAWATLTRPPAETCTRVNSPGSPALLRNTLKMQKSIKNSIVSRVEWGLGWWGHLPHHKSRLEYRLSWIFLKMIQNRHFQRCHSLSESVPAEGWSSLTGTWAPEEPAMYSHILAKWRWLRNRVVCYCTFSVMDFGESLMVLEIKMLWRRLWGGRAQIG